MSIAVATNRYTAALRAHEQRSAAEITAAHHRLKQATTPVFARIVKQLTQAQASNQRIGVWWLYEQNRLQNVLDRVHGATSVYADSAALTVRYGKRQASRIGNAAAQAQLAKRIPAPQVPPPRNQQGQDEDTAALFATLPTDTQNRVRDALLLAASLGITLAMAEMLLNKAVDRLLAVAIGLDVTVEYDAFREELLAGYQANSDVVQAWTWTTAEDERVCPFCESMDGSIHDLSESMESHPRCRCEIEPYFLDTSGDLLQIGA
jgi:hypothetical protein